MQRRHFLTTVVGGGTAILMTGGTVGVWAQRRITPALPAVDPVAAHIERELTRLASDLRVGTRPHETITALASTFRLHAAHVRATQSDTALANALAAQIRRQGRDGLLDAVSGPNARQMHRDMLHAHGLDSLQVDESDISRERANEVLNGLLAGTTLTTVLDQAAALYDTLARQVAHNEVSHKRPGRSSRAAVRHVPHTAATGSRAEQRPAPALRGTESRLQYLESRGGCLLCAGDRPGVRHSRG